MLTTGGLLLIQITRQATSATVRPARSFAATAAPSRTVGSAALSTSAVLVLFAKAPSAALVLTL